MEGKLMKRRLLVTIPAIFIVLSLFSNILATDKNGFGTNMAGAVRQEDEKAVNRPFSLAWFTDSQYYAKSYPEIYNYLGDWFVKEYKNGSIGYVINTGDLVDSASDTKQWKVASQSFKKLDEANVPYGIVAGNHDVAISGLNYSMFGKYFGESRFRGKPWYGGDMDNNRNHYDLISYGDYKFVILCLGYGTENTKETVSWSNDVLKKYEDRNAILALHEYLNRDAKLSAKAQSVFDKIIIPNDNVILVLCGHYHGVAKNVKTVTNSDGSNRNVVEIMANYQKDPYGGNGCLNYITFNPDAGTIKVATFSPYNKTNSFINGKEEILTEKVYLKH
jgi:hypothetical protein